MLFNSYEFIFVFLPICLAGFFLLGAAGWQRAASWWLSGMSLGYYAWWNPDPDAPWSPKYLGLILLSIVFNYFLGVRISKAQEDSRPRQAWRTLVLGVAANLLLLGYYKYWAFFLKNTNSLLGTDFHFADMALPLAISFFTFTQIAYLVDAYHGVTKEYHFRWYLLFVSFFPHLVAGPIVLYRSLMPQFAQGPTWRFNAGNFTAGLSLFGFGLFKKTVFADSLAPLANEAFGQIAESGSAGMVHAWTGAIAYALQLYFDFSGYSDMAIGVARMFNIEFPLNFNSPYKARDIADFWRRWHITLSTFLRDHLYIPLGGNRHGETRRYVNLFATMLLGGLWHGAGWTFVIWGGLHGFYLVICQMWTKATDEVAWAQTRLAVIAGRCLTLLAVLIGWVFFRAHSVTEAIGMLKGMFGCHGAGLPARLQSILGTDFLGVRLSYTRLLGEPTDLLLLLVALLVALFAPNTDEIFRLAQASTERQVARSALWFPSKRWAVISAAVFLIAVLHLSGVSEFLYFQF